MNARGRPLRTVALAALLAAGLACGRSPKDEESAPTLKIEPGAPEAIKAQLTTRPAILAGDADTEATWKAVRKFYEKRAYAPAWIDGRRPTPELDELLESLQTADGEGLDPAMYAAPALAAHRANADRKRFSRDAFAKDDIDDVDVWSTWAFMSYASDISDGVTDPKQIKGTWGMRPAPIDSVKTLDTALRSGEIAKTLESIAPRHPEYMSLRKALADYRDMANNGGWPTLPTNLKLKPGATHAAVPVLRKRLAITHDFKGNADDTSARYDDALVAAVKLFQLRHGLGEDGVVAGETLAAMNVPVAKRIEQIQLNMERWRWLPRDLGPNHARVNIPEYRLDVWEQDRIALTMRVVVGAQDNRTPIFADQMTHIVFSPFWNVPPSIANEETLPAVQNDPGYLARNNLEVVSASGQ